VNTLVRKDWLLNQLEGLLQLNRDTNEFIENSRESLLPEIEEWRSEAVRQIENNSWLIDIIEKQLIRDFGMSTENFEEINQKIFNA
jgi:hypothetical protein